MKRIAFIGTISKQHRSTQLIDLYNQSRIYNTEHDIKGVFLVCKNIILQVLEGDSAELGKAVYNARREERLEDFSIIINTDIEKGLFNSWPIRFVKQNDPVQNSFLSKLKKALLHQVAFNDSKAKELFDSVFTVRDTVVSFPPTALKASEGEPSNIRDFAAHSYLLTAWPKPTQMRLSPPVITACSALVQGSLRYDELLARNIWSSEDELQSFLTRVNGLGILQIYDVGKSTSHARVQASNDKFSQLLKKFIHSPKRQVT